MTLEDYVRKDEFKAYVDVKEKEEELENSVSQHMRGRFSTFLMGGLALFTGIGFLGGFQMEGGPDFITMIYGAISAYAGYSSYNSYQKMKFFSNSSNILSRDLERLKSLQLYEDIMG